MAHPWGDSIISFQLPTVYSIELRRRLDGIFECSHVFHLPPPVPTLFFFIISYFYYDLSRSCLPLSNLRLCFQMGSSATCAASARNASFHNEKRPASRKYDNGNGERSALNNGLFNVFGLFGRSVHSLSGCAHIRSFWRFQVKELRGVQSMIR